MILVQVTAIRANEEQIWTSDCVRLRWRSKAAVETGNKFDLTKKVKNATNAAAQKAMYKEDR